MHKIFCLFLLAGIIITSCRKDFEGDTNTQDAPETYAVVDSVKRDTNNLLSTTVTGSWYGVSKKGFIKGYEVSTDNQQSWQFTKDQQGTFLLNLPIGFDRGNLPVFVRAIDNLNQKDPTPAVMVFPVKNTAPTIEPDFSNPVPASSFPIIKLNWISKDVDGILDISQYEIVLNDTTQTPLSISAQTKDLIVDNFTIANSVRIEAQIAGGQFQTTCNVFATNKTTPLPGTLSGLKLDSVNTVYVRTLDRTLAKSSWTAFSLTVKKPKSDVIMVNCMTSSINATQNTYLSILATPAVNISQVDVVRGINNSVGQAEIYSDAFTQQRTFALFKKMIWLTDDANTLATAQITTINFFNNGGRMFIMSQFGDGFPLESDVLSSTPIKALINPLDDPMFTNGNFRIDNTCSASSSWLSGWPVVQYNNAAPFQSVRPFKTYDVSTGVFGYDSLMSCVLKVQTTNIGSPYWNGPSVVMSKRYRINNMETDMIITSMPMHLMNANTNVDSLFRKVFIDELNFQ
jgi:hypothetical protein